MIVLYLPVCYVTACVFVPFVGFLMREKLLSIPYLFYSVSERSMGFKSFAFYEALIS